MVDKNTVMQVLCGLMLRPQYLSEKDKYNLTINDFNTYFDKYVFSAIFNLYQGGAESINVADIDNYFNAHETAKVTFEKENGVEFLQDGIEFTEVDNFPFYYRRLKKFNCLRDLNKMGFDTRSFYEEDLTNPKAKEINDKFESLEVKDIFDGVHRKMMYLESTYSTGDASEVKSAADGIKQLLEDLKVRPEVGAPLQGDIFNTVTRGARRGKFYIRTASSGAGKTRNAVGDMCYLSYPIRFNLQKWQWEWNGSNEKSLFIATEQKIDEVQTLILSYLTGFDEEKFLYYNFDEVESKIVLQATQVMETFKDNVHIVTLPNPNIEQIKSVVRQNWILYDIKNVFYDYIFSSPGLLSEFRDLKIREDVALGMLSTALKDLAVEMDLFVCSSTQTNAKANDENGEKNETIIRGSRAIIDKCDIACVIGKVSENDLELLNDLVDGIIPSHVTDIYKVRRGKYTDVKIWSLVNLGNCRKKDLFITTKDFKEVQNFRTTQFTFNEENSDFIMKTISDLNEDCYIVDETEREESVEIIDINNIKINDPNDFSDLL